MNIYSQKRKGVAGMPRFNAMGPRGNRFRMGRGLGPCGKGGGMYRNNFNPSGETLNNSSLLNLSKDQKIQFLKLELENIEKEKQSIFKEIEKLKEI
jgi:hypothetical protein